MHADNLVSGCLAGEDAEVVVRHVHGQLFRRFSLQFLKTEYRGFKFRQGVIYRLLHIATLLFVTQIIRIALAWRRSIPT
jgi:hypothetical protein